MKAKSIMALFLLSIGGFLTLSAQEIKPNIVQEGRLWSFYQAPAGGIAESFRLTGKNTVMFFGTDTLIDGKTYKNVLYRRVFYWDNFDELPVYNFGCALREDGAKVYYYDYEKQEERLMFDFSLKPGDTVETYSKFVVTSVGVTEGEMPLRYIDLKDAEGWCTDRWIEKVGSQEKGLFWETCWCCLGAFRDLACCKEDKDSEPFFRSMQCLSAEYTTVTGIISFAPANTDSSMLYAVIDNPDEQEYDALKRMTLMRNSTPFAQRLVVDGKEYFAGDKVEITGWRSSDLGFSDLEIVSIRKGNTSVETVQKAGLILSPNPATETIRLTATGCNIQKVEILDANGKVLYATAVNEPSSFLYDVSRLSSGLYCARVKTTCGVFTEKFTVK
ncbi:MAG: T9SS type A sorting domain-containing protein [Lentimicrobiaceae bacterium]|nr:T9SS type A sorting domain-containing protein [Lentimicrobiaceae bacterium]